jgi:hypothetical protein
MDGLLFTLFIAGLLFGAFGAMIANNKGADATTGFLLGAFLGPIGCLIAALLSPALAQELNVLRRAEKTLTSCDNTLENQSLDNAQYRLWLVKTYAIERNEVLGEVICGKRSFKTIEEALFFAHELENAKNLGAAQAREALAAQLDAEATALGITFDGEVYHYKTYRYQALKDAVAYARLGKD